MGQQRAHHYVPACLLVGFTREGTRRSPLHVFDRVKREWRPSTPDKSAKENDFYTVDRPSLDPLEAENALARIEDAAAPVLREATVSGRLPSGDAEITLINFVAVQDARSPVTRVQEWAARQRFWVEQTRRAVAGGRVEFVRRQASDDVTLPDFDTFEDAQRALANPELAFGDTTDSVNAVFELASSSMDKLNRLQWSLLVARADAPDFVCSDEPVLHFATSASRERGLGLGLPPSSASPADTVTVLIIGLTRVLAWWVCRLRAHAIPTSSRPPRPTPRFLEEFAIPSQSVGRFWPWPRTFPAIRPPHWAWRCATAEEVKTSAS